MTIDERWRAPLQEEDQRLTMRNIRTLCLIAMLLVPLAGVLDYLAYPNLWKNFFGARAAVSLIEILFLTVSYTGIGRKHYRLLMLLVPLVPAMAIAWMIYRSGDPASPYYAGLTLVLVGVGFLYQWSHVESIIAVIITLALYLAATLPLVQGANLHEGSIGEFVNNGVFLILNSVVIITGSLVHHRIRLNEIISRLSLAENRKELEQKNQQLVEMDRLKTDFFSNITHELRTPLTLMIAPLQRLQRLYGTDQKETSGLSVELAGIYQNSLRLLKLINDLLDLSSVDSGRTPLAREKFSLNDFTGVLFQSVSSLAQHGGVTTTLHYETSLEFVLSDREKLEKVLLNLIFNAVKFTPAGGTVRMVVRNDAGHLVFEVADTGVGISQQHLPFIFDRFWQADSSSTRRHPGTGLGLALVKEIVDRFGGSVVAESELGKGTTIRVRLPLVQQDGNVILGRDQFGEGCIGPSDAVEHGIDQQAGSSEVDAELETSSTAKWIKSVYHEAEQSQSMLARKSWGLLDAEVLPQETGAQALPDQPLILIVDDDPGLLRFMSSELGADYRVIAASNGAQALELAASHGPDMLISDYMMPGLDGLALCRALRDRPESKLMPIMLVTARSDEEVRLTALSDGANDVMVKPFSLTEFHIRVHNLVQAGLLRKEIEHRNVELECAIGELRSTEKELIQSEKMVALGILTGGIMHEINNPLNFARSALYILNRQAAKLPEEARADIQEIATDMGECINRIATIVSDLRIFCHPETAITSTCPISDPLQSALRILAGPVKDGRIEIQNDVPAECGAVRGDRNQLTLVFINIIKNAIDALAGQGESNSSRPVIKISASDEASELEVRISDNGPGISPENLSRIFDPFFTTKVPGEGTGLGLALCYRIVIAHGGTINVSSAPHQGVEFVLRLPFAHETESPDAVVVPENAVDTAPVLAG